MQQLRGATLLRIELSPAQFSDSQLPNKLAGSEGVGARCIRQRAVDNSVTNYLSCRACVWRGLALCLDSGQSAYDLDGGYQM